MMNMKKTFLAKNEIIVDFINSQKDYEHKGVLFVKNDYLVNVEKMIVSSNIHYKISYFSLFDEDDLEDLEDDEFDDWLFSEEEEDDNSRFVENDKELACWILVYLMMG